MKLLPLILLCLSGCCYVRTADVTVVDVGTGRRTVIVDNVKVTHSEVPEVLNALAPIAEAAAQGAVKGAIGKP